MSIVGGQLPVPSARAPMFARYGLAVDIGTTTLCAALLDKNGQLGHTARKNPQTSFGADVISRIEKSMSGYAGQLAGCLAAVISEIADELAAGAGIPIAEIDAAVLTGNTTMLHLLTRQDCTPLSRAPFAAERLFGEYTEGSELEIPSLRGAKVYLPRCPCAFVGGDITTAILASGLCESRGSAMLVDIGTNGEIALWHEGELTCSSTAAGPAFEGAGLSCGTYATTGAIDRVWLESGKPCCSTIGGGCAVGICGSGIIDALTVMLELGVIDETGAMADTDNFELRDGICITDKDVRKIQLAKGAVRAGMETMLESLSLAKDKLEVLYIAGGFGSRMDLKNAAAIGLIPEELRGLTKVIGNAALAGAALILGDKALAAQSEQLIGRAKILPLDSSPAFTENFMEYMAFE